MSILSKLEAAMPLIEKAAALNPTVNKVFQTTKQIVGPQQDWSKNSKKVTSNLMDYCTQNNKRISTALDAIRVGTKSRKFIDSILPGFGNEAEQEIERLANEQSQTKETSSKNLTRERYSIFPVNKR